MEKKRTKKEKRRLVLRIFLVVILSLILICLVVFMSYRSKFQGYFDNSTVLCKIPDISKGFIPQGITYDTSTDNIFLTGYKGDGSHSPIYAIDRQSGELVRKVLLNTVSGEKFNGHAGGLSIYGDFLYLAGSTDYCMYPYAISDVLNAEDSGFICAKEKTDLQTDKDYIRVSFTSNDADYLYAGEFHKEPVFYTNDSHEVSVPNGKQKAFLFGFEVDPEGNAVPKCVYSIPDNIQGAAFDDGYVFLSKSHGAKPSKILTYKLNDSLRQGDINVLGKEVPLYVLTDDNADKITFVPPMSEELIVIDSRMYILFEAASNRYIFGKMLGEDKIYSTPVDYFK